MILEPAILSDWEAINALAMQVHTLHVLWRPDIYAMPQTLFTEERVKEDIQGNALYVVRRNGRVIAYVRLGARETGYPGLVKRKILLVEELCVSEDLRGQGIGTEMMSDIQALAKKLGCTDLELSVYPENEAAWALYRKCGFAVRDLQMQRKV